MAVMVVTKVMTVMTDVAEMTMTMTMVMMTMIAVMAVMTGMAVMAVMVERVLAQDMVVALDAWDPPAVSQRGILELHQFVHMDMIMALVVLTMLRGHVQVTVAIITAAQKRETPQF